MNEDILRYKYRFITIVLLLSYAFLHTHLTGVLTITPLEGLINFSTRLPFAQRLLVPALANIISRILPLEVSELFFLLEWLFISLFYFSLRELLQQEFDPIQAQLLSWLSILLLPLITVINYRYRAYGEAEFFYPSDTASLFFMALGFLFCLRKQWFYFIPWVFIATLNRETSILLVLMILALYWQKRREVLKVFFFALLAYVLARILILLFLHQAPGPILEWYSPISSRTYFETNLQWLFQDQNILLFVFCIAGLPFFWFAFFDFIPLKYRPLRYIALFNFLVLLVVGKFTEPRIFSEIWVLLYLPVCVAVKNWLSQQKPFFPDEFGIIYYIDRYVILSLLGLIVIFQRPLNLVIWLFSLS